MKKKQLQISGLANLITKSSKQILRSIIYGLVATVFIFGSTTRSSAQTLYGVSGSGGSASTLYTINPSTGAIISTIGSTGQNHISALAVHPSTGIIYAHINTSYGGSGYLATLNPTSGAATVIGSTGLQVPDMTFAANGTLYAWAENNDALWTINLSTAASTSIGSSTGTWQTGLCFAPSGKLYLKISNYGMYEVNPTNGSVSNFLSLSGGDAQNMLAFNSSGVAYTGYRNSSSSFTLKTINLSTGAISNIGSNSIGRMSALAFGAGCTGTISSISAVPSNTTYTGGVNTNLYIGYPNNTPSDTLKAIGGGNSTSWSPATYLSCTSCSTTVFSPTAAGTYTITASCGSSSKTVTICVKDLRVPNTSGTKAAVYMCHKEPGTTTTKTLAVLLRGIPSHFQYHSGDKLGVCGNTCATNKRDFEFETLVVDEQYLEVMCSPNPFRQSFKLHYISNSEEEATVAIYGMTGNLVETVTLAGVADEAELGSNLPNGIYTVSFIQGDKNRVFRMIKVD